MSHEYSLSYRLVRNDPPLSKEEAKAKTEEGYGSCDAAVVMAILYPEDGSYSVLLSSLDGRTGEDLSDHEVFKAWWVLASRLAQSTTLDPGRAQFARITFESFADLLQRDDDDDDEGREDA